MNLALVSPSAQRTGLWEAPPNPRPQFKPSKVPASSCSALQSSFIWLYLSLSSPDLPREEAAPRLQCPPPSPCAYTPLCLAPCLSFVLGLSDCPTFHPLQAPIPNKSSPVTFRGTAKSGHSWPLTSCSPPSYTSYPALGGSFLCLYPRKPQTFPHIDQTS